MSEPLNIEDDGPRYPLEAMTGGRRSGVRRIDQPGRVPPQALEVEREIIGRMLMDGADGVGRVIEMLPPEAFYKTQHLKIVSAIYRVFDRGDKIDQLIVEEELKRSGDLDGVDGSYNLATMLRGSYSISGNIEKHALIILERAKARRMIEFGTHLVSRAYQVPEEDILSVVDQAEQDLFQISQDDFGNQIRPATDGVDLYLEELFASDNPSGVTGTPTGFKELDSYTGGWQRSDLVIIGARPSIGKTAFALTEALHAAGASASNYDPDLLGSVLYFTLEMSAEQLRDRLLSTQARVDANRIRRRNLTAPEKHRLMHAAGRLKAMPYPILIDDTFNLTLSRLKSRTRQTVYREKAAGRRVGLVIVDYLQLLTGDQSGNREQEISGLSRGLKGLAKELHIPVMALSQLSRAVETRADKRPMLSDLRESGGIEQDSDVVVFLHRPERYGITKDDDGQDTQGKAFLLVAKQRNGPIGDITTSFVKQFAAFEEYSERKEFDRGEAPF